MKEGGRREKSRQEKREPHRWWLRQVALGLLLTTVTTVALLGSISGEYNLAVGDVVPQDIRAPREITYLSRVLT